MAKPRKRTARPTRVKTRRRTGRQTSPTASSGAFVGLWHFPKEDFALWRSTCADNSDFKTHEEYETRLKDMETVIASSGAKVQHIYLPLAELMSLLEKRGLKNTGENRALLLSDLAGETTQRQAVIE